jgi:hypothetical protein
MNNAEFNTCSPSTRKIEEDSFLWQPRTQYSFPPVPQQILDWNIDFHSYCWGGLCKRIAYIVIYMRTTGVFEFGLTDRYHNDLNHHTLLLAACGHLMCIRGGE